MRLSDILGHMDLAIYPIIAMVIFLGIFATALIRVATRPRELVTRQAALPLTDPNDDVLARRMEGGER